MGTKLHISLHEPESQSSDSIASSLASLSLTADLETVPSSSNASPTSDFAALPMELALQIFEIIYAVLDENGISYFPPLRPFAALRLVCSYWDQLITPILYRNLSLRLRVLPVLADALAVRGHLVRHIAIKSERGLHNPPPETTKLVQRCIASCSALKVLECDNIFQKLTFISRNWLQRTSPNLALTLKSLSITFGGGHPIQCADLSISLMGLGRVLESLDIYGWRSRDDTPSRFHLPTSMPHLSRITFNETHLPIHLVHKLLSRVVTTEKPNRGPKSARRVPLRELVFSDVTGVDQAEMLALLRINNLGTYLTSLQLSTPLQGISTNFLKMVFKACPMLLDFLYTCESLEVLEYLPHGLEHLTMNLSYYALPSHRLKASFSLFPQYMAPLLQVPLRMLTITLPVYSISTPEDIRKLLPALAYICDEKGIAHNIVRPSMRRY